MNKWTVILNAARSTVNKEGVGKEPSSQWKHSILLAEHSPIRLLTITYTWESIKSWVSVHFVRHWLGIVHFVSTQRDDRTGLNRDDKPQSSLVKHTFEANAQAIINISRKRLCYQAHRETRAKWEEFLDYVEKVEPELRSVCVKECVYRGFCPEMSKCGYSNTEQFDEELRIYRK